MKQRILIINLYSEMGGGEIATMQMLKHLDRTRFEPVMMFNQRGPFVDQVEDLGIETVILPYPAMTLRETFTLRGRKIMREASQEFEQYLTAHPVNLIQCTDVIVLMFIARAVKKHRCCVVYNCIFKYERTRMVLFNLYAARMIDAIITHSPMIAADCRRRTIGLSKKIHTIPLGVDATMYRPRKDDEENLLRKISDISPGAKLVGMVSRFDPIKGHDIFLRAAKRVLETRQDVVFYCIGGSVLVDQLPGARRYRDEILALHNELQIGNRLKFIDEHPDVPALMRALDILVCPSHSEGFGLVVLEALASGVPVIAGRAVGAVEYFDDEPALFIAEPHSEDSFVRAILHLLEHLGHRHKGYAVSETVIRRFTWQAHASACERVYEGQESRRALQSR
jgi:glycosyltransferase involved in cell wall biosynthesis